MDKRLKITAITVLICIFSVGLFLTQAFAWTHGDVPLKNELGEPIRPDRNPNEPYSPRQTCGGCHGYAIITSGYHFQQGFDQMSDRFDAKKPWVLSPGMYGKWSPFTAAGRLARKVNGDPKEIDLSTYDWIGGAKLDGQHKIKTAACGWCHPGGGPLEYGRKADGRADLSMNLIQAEARNKSSHDGDFSSRFTPDGKSHFRESGVLEADCLMCHLPGYRFHERNQQIDRRNYRWAATAGAGLITQRIRPHGAATAAGARRATGAEHTSVGPDEVVVRIHLAQLGEGLRTRADLSRSAIDIRLALSAALLIYGAYQPRRAVAVVDARGRRLTHRRLGAGNDATLSRWAVSRGVADSVAFAPGAYQGAAAVAVQDARTADIDLLRRATDREPR